MGWPAEIPKKNFRLKGKGAALEAVGGAVPASDSATSEAGRDGEGGGGDGRGANPNSSAGLDGAPGGGVEEEGVVTSEASPKVFTVVLECGLANRLRTILGFKYVRDNTPGSTLKVRWRPSVACPGLFSDVFQPIQGVEFIDEEEERALVYHYYRVQNSDGAGGSNNDGETETTAAPAPARATVAGSAGHASDEGSDVLAAAPALAAAAGAAPNPPNGRVVMFKGQATCKTIIRRFLTNAGGDAGEVAGGDAANAEMQAPCASFLNVVSKPIGRNVGGSGGSGGSGVQGADMAAILADLYTAPALNDALQEQVEAFASEHNVRQRIGLHIRRTDHVRTAKARGTFTDDATFVGVIEAAVKADPEAAFFLATDNLTTQQAILNHPSAKGRVAVFSEIADPGQLPATTQKTAGKGPGVGSLVAFRHTSLEHSAIDLFLLSKCSVIHGSADSSFSICAQLLHTNNNANGLQ